MRTETEILHNAHQFLLEMRREAQSFSKDDFRRAVNSDEMFERYWLSGFVQLLDKVDDVGPERFIVGSGFGGCMGRGEFVGRMLGMQREDFRYSVATHSEVINYEFFMPLVHVKNLKVELDSLFFKDTILNRLEALGLPEVQWHFPKIENENDADYLERLYGWLGDKFGGYSMSKVDGRFRMSPLKPRAEAVAALMGRGEKYLVDEQTVVVRFIFKCGKSAAQSYPGYVGRCELPSANDGRDVTGDAHLVQYFFWKLFVESVIKSVNGEAEIWLVESGMRSCLHVWSRTAGWTTCISRDSERVWYTPLLDIFGIGGSSESGQSSRAP